MANKEYLNVNELATLFGLNVQTLHYYDKIGILKPSYRDPKNGYRKYRFDPGSCYRIVPQTFCRLCTASVCDYRTVDDGTLARDAERCFGFRIYGGNRNDDVHGRTMPAGRVSGLGELNGYDTGTDAVRDGKGTSDRKNPCKPYFADFYFAADLSGDSCRVRGCNTGTDPEGLLWFLHVLDVFFRYCSCNLCVPAVTAYTYILWEIRTDAGRK